MSASTYDELAQHVGHAIECVSYADGANVAVECVDCYEVIMDFDHPENTFDVYTRAHDDCPIETAHAHPGKVPS